MTIEIIPKSTHFSKVTLKEIVVTVEIKSRRTCDLYTHIQAEIQKVAKIVLWYYNEDREAVDRPSARMLRMGFTNKEV